MALVAALILGACGQSDEPEAAAAPSVVVTTSMWADALGAIDCNDVFDVKQLVDTGGDPHLTQPSARMRQELGEADVIVENGYGLEGLLLDLVHDAEEDGVAVLAVADFIHDPLEASDDGHDHGHDHGHDEHAEEGHDEHDEDGEAHDEHDAHDDHGDEGHDEHEEGHDDHDEVAESDATLDPHFWLDPVRSADALEHLWEEMLVDTGLAADSPSCLDDYTADLLAIDADIKAELATTPHRTIATNHDVLSYFADRYDLDVAFSLFDSLVPDDASAAHTGAASEELEHLVEERGSVGIIVAATENVDLASDVAAGVEGVHLVPVALEALAEPGNPGDTYLGMLRELGHAVAEELTGETHSH